jgi:Rrf2 family protein
MKISTRARYGTRLMLELGLRYGKGPVFLKDIARSEDISEKYLSQIIIPLRTAGLVDSFRGSKGGYILARSPAAITLKDIVGVVEGGFDLTAAKRKQDDRQKVSQRVMHGVWKSLGDTIANKLSETTIENLIQMYQHIREEAVMYNI